MIDTTSVAAIPVDATLHLRGMLPRPLCFKGTFNNIEFAQYDKQAVTLTDCGKWLLLAHLNQTKANAIIVKEVGSSRYSYLLPCRSYQNFPKIS
jgi:hypothetical protein